MTCGPTNMRLNRTDSRCRSPSHSCAWSESLDTNGKPPRPQPGFARQPSAVDSTQLRSKRNSRPPINRNSVTWISKPSRAVRSAGGAGAPPPRSPEVFSVGPRETCSSPNSGTLASTTVARYGGISWRPCFAAVAGAAEVLARSPIHGDLQAHRLSLAWRSSHRRRHPRRCWMGRFACVSRRLFGGRPESAGNRPIHKPAQFVDDFCRLAAPLCSRQRLCGSSKQTRTRPRLPDSAGSRSLVLAPAWATKQKWVDLAGHR